MELMLRFVFAINIILGWIFSPIYVLLYNTPKKRLPRLKEPEISKLSATALAEKIRTRVLSCEQVMSTFIERCEQVNNQLNAIIEHRFTDALEEAKNIDRMIRSGEKTIEELERETPLLGVPITVKETCKVQGMSYTSGAKLRKHIKASEDGEAVACLRKAGAIPIAVTNIPELACTFDTCNDLFGFTCNPYDRNFSAGGSSGGEACIISSGASVVGLASDLGGSIRVPSLYNGVFGHKPTSGIVSTEGHFPNRTDEQFKKLLTLGPICRYAEDLKLMLKVLAGANAYLLKLHKPVNVSLVKIYYLPDEGFSLSQSSVQKCIKECIQTAVQYFKNDKKCFTQQINLPEMDDRFEICATQFFIMENGQKIFCLKEPKNESSFPVELLKNLIKKSDYSWNVLMIRSAMKICPYFMPKANRPKYIAAEHQLANRLKEILGNDGVLLYPTFATLAHRKNQTFWKYPSFSYPMIVNVLGFPATHVTMGLDDSGLPMGFQVIAAPNQDRLCLAVAEDLEKQFGGWVDPSSS